MKIELEKCLSLLNDVRKSIEKYKFKIKKYEDDIQTANTFLELEERKLLQLKEEIKRLGGEVDDEQDKQLFSIDDTLQIVKQYPEGANLQKILDHYKARGVNTYIKVIRKHIDTLLQQDKVYPADVWKKKGIKYLAR